jgi:hypothetical protein
VNVLPPSGQRRLVDHTLQRSLLIALVLLETALTALAIWLLYRALGQVMDENMYRIHFPRHASAMGALVSAGTPLLAAMLGANVLALIAADRIWAWYVHGILAALGRSMRAARALDFSPHPAGTRLQHAVLELAAAWRADEARGLACLRARLAALPDGLPAAPHAQAALAAQLAALLAQGGELDAGDGGR